MRPFILIIYVVELARDFLNSTGNYNVIGGIISPVCDAYIPRATKV